MLVALAVLASGCVGLVGELGRDGGGPMKPPKTSPPPELPGAVVVEVLEHPTTPTSEDGATWTGPEAAELSGVQAVPNRDSAVLVLPVVEGAVDYRVYRLPAGARVTDVNGGAQVDGTVVHCAGYRQRNDRFSGTRELMQLVEVTDLAEPTALVVEAIDAPCPFQGHLAPVHEDLEVTIDEVPEEDRIRFSFFTAEEIRGRFGSLIFNGHGPGAQLAQPGPTTPPRVLARTWVRVTPSGRGAPLTRDFFEDFDGTGGAWAFEGRVSGHGRTYTQGRRFGNASWEAFIYNDDLERAQLSEERGVLHVTLPDWFQDVFSSVVLVPRKPAALSDADYLHLTWEVASNATSRRYWWVGLCGAETAGETFDAEGRFAGNLVQTSFFYQDDGKNVSAENWNCLQFFPRDGSPFEIGPWSRSEADIRVMINQAGAPDRSGVHNLSPAQYPSYAATPSWFATQDKDGNFLKQILADELTVGHRVRFDAYVRRDRLVLYVNGEQRLCNDFGDQRLTMAEAAVAWGQVLYHSAAERLEFSRDYNDRTGQRYYLENAPYADEREWDNLGFESGVGMPAMMDESQCFVAR